MEDYEKMASDVGVLSWVPLGIHFEVIHVLSMIE